MQFSGYITKIGDDKVEITFDQKENRDVVIEELLRLKKNLLTVYMDKEYKVSLPQQIKLQHLINTVADSLDITVDPSILKVDVAEAFLKRKLGVEDVFSGTKEDASILIQSIIEMCHDNGIDTGGPSDLLKQISGSNKAKACIVCGEEGETVPLKEFNSSKISDFRMGYKYVTLCGDHYMEVINTGVDFFKKYHLIQGKKS